MSLLKTYLTLDENTAPWWEDPITDIVQLTDGNIACCVHSSVDIQIWCPNTGSLINEIKLSEESSVNKIALLNSGMLACGSNNGSVTICDPITGLIVNELEGHDGSVETLRTLQDDSLVSYSHGNIKIWNSETGKLKTNVVVDFDEIIDGELAILSDDHFILTRNRCPIWNREECEWNHELGFDIGDLFYCSINKIFGVDESEQLYSLDSRLGKTIISRNTRCENESISQITALDDEQIITGYSNGFVKIWNKKNQVKINLFTEGLNIDNIFKLNDGRILTFAETRGKIWSIS